MTDNLAAELGNIVSLLRQRRMAEAVQRCRRLLQTDPDAPEPWRLWAQIAGSGGDVDEALAAYGRAVSLRPHDIDLHIEMAQAALAGNRRRAALEAAHAAAALAPSQPAHLDALGVIYTHCEEAARALPLFEAANAAAPNTPSYLFNLAAAQRMAGRLDEAETTLQRLIQISPGETRAHLMRADLRKQTPAKNHVGELERALDEQRGGESGEIELCYALAKEFEDIGEPARAFAYLKRGAARQHARLRRRIETDTHVLEQLRIRHTAEALSAPPHGFDSEEPIFVLGLPRSGTTLVERMLASHPQVSSIGESPAFDATLRRRLHARLGRPPSNMELVELSLQLDPRDLGEAYLEETRPQSGVTLRFVDKMLINYLYAGLIKRALPRAKIIALRREAIDNCYAMYKSYLTGAFGFTSSLGDIAKYYGAWSRLMDHWKETLGSALHIVQYETLVHEPEPTVRAILRHAALDWDKRCLSFHRAQTAVTSASASQVRQPIYTTSVGKWRVLRQELGELIEGLRAEGIAID